MIEPDGFLGALFAGLERLGVDVEGFELDHVCYRVATAERYAGLKAELGAHAELIGEQLVAGRPIATYCLHRPWPFGGRKIDVVEVPAPKEGSPYPEGFEHAEFVIGEEPLDFARRYAQLEWDFSGVGKSVNPDVRLRIEHISVKFHRKTLVEVIQEERAAAGV